MARRALAATLGAVILVIGSTACRQDTVRTNAGGPTTTAAEPTTSTRRGAKDATSTSGRSTGSTATSGAAGAASDTSGGSGVVLGGAELGATRLGAKADDAVAAVRAQLGAPTRDLKQPGAERPGPDRLVRFGRFSLYMSAGALVGWGYESLPEGPPQLATPSGITVGSTVATVRRVYGDKARFEPEDDPFPATFSVQVGGSTLTGTLTGTADGSTTTGLYYGAGCGE